MFQPEPVKSGAYLNRMAFILAFHRGIHPTILPWAHALMKTVPEVSDALAAEEMPALED